MPKTFLHILQLYIVPIHENTIVNTTSKKNPLFQAVVIGESEIASGIVKIRSIEAREEVSLLLDIFGDIVKIGLYY